MSEYFDIPFDDGLVVDTEIYTPKPKTFNCHYSNPDSQASLICDTPDFPKSYSKTEYYKTMTSNILRGFHPVRYDDVVDFLGFDDQMWGTRISGDSKFNLEMLKRLGQLIFDLPNLPKHARLVHYYENSTGYSIPQMEVVYDK